MKASRFCWLALCLLLSGFSMELMAQKNLEAVVQKCKSDKSVDKSIVTKRDPKTKELQKIISSFTIEDNPTLQQEVKTAFEQDKEDAYQVIENESNGNMDYFIRFSKANVKVSYSMDSRDTKLSFTVIENFEKGGDKGTDFEFGNDM